MEVDDEVWDLVNMRKRSNGILATADRKGNCNVAIYGSLQLSDLETMTMTIGDTRTLANLKQNPKASFLVFTGESFDAMKGARLYLEVTDIIEEGPVLDKGRMMITEAAGREAAEAMRAFVTFKVVEVRPLTAT
ncbi:MAG: pyridoxamine 5'-phosphate oxidase family protein [Actinobacteria bacterium]|nr:pyridoxamine 5'-phosphate oxidase family protein [Actinomycetota bacterium]